MKPTDFDFAVDGMDTGTTLMAIGVVAGILLLIQLIYCWAKLGMDKEKENGRKKDEYIKNGLAVVICIAEYDDNEMLEDLSGVKKDYDSYLLC